LSKAAAMGPKLIASTVLMAFIGTALPNWAGITFAYGALMAAILLCLGFGESAAVRLQFRAKRMNASQQTTLAPVITELCQRGLGPPLVKLYVTRRPATGGVTPFGRSSIVIPREFLQAFQTEHITSNELLALLVHAATLARGGFTRSDPTIAFWA